MILILYDFINVSACVKISDVPFLNSHSFQSQQTQAVNRNRIPQGKSEIHVSLVMLPNNRSAHALYNSNAYRVDENKI